MKNFFLYLSKTDSNIIEQLIHVDYVTGQCARLAQVSLGVMVLITGVLAFASGSYALYTTFQDGQIAAAVGFIYACLIMAFDREIVSASDKRTVWIRFPLAILIGVAVALPLEMRLLQGRIDKQLELEAQTDNKDAQTRHDQLLDGFRQEQQRLRTEVSKYRDEVNKWGAAMDAEVTGKPGDSRLGKRTGKAGVGPAYLEAQKNKTDNQKLLEQAEAGLQKHLAEEGKVSSEAERVSQERFVKQRYDFLSRFGALERLKSEATPEGGGARKISWGLRLLFIFFEVFPALVKLFTPDNVYTGLIETERLVKINDLFSAANQRMSNPPPANYPPPPFNSVVNYPQVQPVNPAGAANPIP